MGIRAEDLTVGWYVAHDSGQRDCEIRKVERLDERTVEITYFYSHQLHVNEFPNERVWSVKHYFSEHEYVIEELGVL